MKTRKRAALVAMAAVGFLGSMLFANPDCPYVWKTWQCGWSNDPEVPGAQRSGCEKCGPQDMCVGNHGFYYRNFSILGSPAEGESGYVRGCESTREIVCADEWTCKWSDAICPDGLRGWCEKDQRLTGPAAGVRVSVPWLCAECDFEGDPG